MFKKMRLALVILFSCFSIGLYFVDPFGNFFNKKDKNRLKISFCSDVFNLDPIKVHDVISAELSIHLHEGLFRSSENGTIVPGIAKHVEVSSDGLSYIFHLRKSKWSDGSDLTAHDFVRSWKRGICDKTCPYSFRFDLIKGVQEFRDSNDWSLVKIKVLSDQLLSVELVKPVPYFTHLMCCPQFFPVHEDFLTKNISNGPFVLKNIKTSDIISLDKNKHFWDVESVKINGMDIYIVEESDNRMSMFFNDEIDFIGGIISHLSSECVEELFKHGFSPVKKDVANVSMVCCNTKDPILRSVKIRKALSMSLDRERLVEGVFKNSKAAFLYIPKVLSGRNDDFLTQDLPTAARLLKEGLDELGVESDDLTIHFLSSGTVSKFAQALQDQWKQNLGLNIVIDTTEFKSMISKLNSSEFMLASIGSVADYPDPITFLENYSSDDLSGNYSKWSNERYDELFEKSFTLTGNERDEVLIEMENLILESLPFIPVCFGTEIIEKKQYLEGYTVTLTRLIDFSRCVLQR